MSYSLAKTAALAVGKLGRLARLGAAWPLVVSRVPMPQTARRKTAWTRHWRLARLIARGTNSKPLSHNRDGRVVPWAALLLEKGRDRSNVCEIRIVPLHFSHGGQADCTFVLVSGLSAYLACLRNCCSARHLHVAGVPIENRLLWLVREG